MRKKKLDRKQSQLGRLVAIFFFFFFFFFFCMENKKSIFFLRGITFEKLH